LTLTAYEFVLQHINLGSRIEGVARQDFYELPIKTIREIISNAVCHRSYLTPGKIQVALFDDRLEVTSPGMLDSEITIEKMKTGLSKIRNKGIAAAFSYMNVVEAWGSGIPKMFREAKEYGLVDPELIDMGSDFRVNLYRKAANVDLNGVINPKDSATDATNSATNATNATDSLTEDEKKVIDSIRVKADATQKELQSMTGITLGTIKRILPRLQEKGMIERVGNRRSGKWQIND
jgi:ATP-dependent DNA helicase RecG